MQTESDVTGLMTL